MMQKPNPVETAKKILREKYPEALFAFVAGSFNRGEETAFSDIDLVVVYRNLKQAYREAFIFDGWPVEGLVHDLETLRYFMAEVDYKEGMCGMPQMVLEGAIVPEMTVEASAIRDEAKEIIRKGPPLWNDVTIYHARYAITDLMDDLRAPRNLEECVAVVARLHELLANFYFRAQGKWSASHKQIPRKLKVADANFALQWNKAFQEAFLGKPEAVIALAEEVIKPYGGQLFAGYHRLAPPEWRIALD